MPTIPFNRALLLNIGVLESLEVYDYQCFIFHDVDLLPENDNNMYSCPEHPRHMSVAVDRMGYKSVDNVISILTKLHIPILQLPWYLLCCIIFVFGTLVPKISQRLSAHIKIVPYSFFSSSKRL